MCESALTRCSVTFARRDVRSLDIPLWQARIAVITTAAFHTPDQPAFDESLRGGDVSFRLIPVGTRLEGAFGDDPIVDPTGV